jgi:hypothetical protein
MILPISFMCGKTKLSISRKNYKSKCSTACG